MALGVVDSRLNVMFWRLFGKFTLLFTFLETGSYHLPSCQCLRMGPTRVRTKKVQKGTASGGTPPPRLLEAQKNTWGGYISRGQVKYFSEISCLTPPQIFQG